MSSSSASASAVVDISDDLEVITRSICRQIDAYRRKHRQDNNCADILWNLLPENILKEREFFIF